MFLSSAFDVKFKHLPFVWFHINIFKTYYAYNLR